MLTYLADSSRVVHDCFHVHPARKFVFFIFAKSSFIGHSLKFTIQLFLIHMKLYRNRLKVKRKRSTVTNGVRKRIAAHIASAIFLGTKGCKSVFINTIDRRTGQSKEESIRQSHSHFFTQITFLGSVSFIDHDDDVITRIQLTANLTKLKNRSNKDFSHITTEEGKKFFFCGCTG